jgi:lipopolysaccharide export system protein LptA
MLILDPFDGRALKPFRLTRSSKERRNWRRIAYGAIIILILPAVILAEDQPSEIGALQGESGERIQIIADKMITNNVEKYAEFAGDVKTTYPNFAMVSDTLRIYYKDNLPGNQELIERIVASGNVTITSDKYTAQSQSAEYDMHTMILVLEGDDSMVQSGKNILTGSKITIYRKDEKINVEGGPQKRVKAVFYSNKNAEKQQW